MSWRDADDPIPGDAYSCDAIDTVVVPRARDIGSFEVSNGVGRGPLIGAQKGPLGFGMLRTVCSAAEP